MSHTTIDYASASTPQPSSRPLFWCAVAVAFWVFPLIFMGGMVTSHGAGLSVPDWPNSYGYNMFLFPPSQWIGGIFFEHTHRLLGTLSGFLSIALVCIAWGPATSAGVRHRLAVFAFAMATLTVLTSVGGLVPRVANRLPYGLDNTFSHLAVLFASLGAIAAVAWCCRRREPRRWVRWLTVLQLLLIIVQGILGGTRVTAVSLTLAMIHGCFAQVFFCLTAFTALATSRWWTSARTYPLPALRTTTWLAAIVWVCVFAQLVIGVLMRHNKAGLAIPDLPLAYGRLLPPTTAAGLEAVNAERGWHYELAPVTLAQIWLHFGHRIGAIVVTTAILALVFQIVRNLGSITLVMRLAAILLCLVVTQFTFGLLTVYFKKPAEIASSHVAFGALTLMTAALLWAVALRVRQKSPATVATKPPIASNLNLATA